MGSPPCEAVESEKLVHLVHSFVAGLSLAVEWPFCRRVGCSTSAGTSCAPAPPPRNVRGVPLPRSARDLHPAAAKFTQPCGATCGCMQIHAACAAPALIPCSLFAQVARSARDPVHIRECTMELRYLCLQRIKRRFSSGGLGGSKVAQVSIFCTGGVGFFDTIGFAGTMDSILPHLALPGVLQREQAADSS